MLRLVQGLKNRMLSEMMMMIGYMKAWNGDFGDDIFVAPNSTPQGSAPTSGNAPNTAQHQVMLLIQPQNQAMHPMQLEKLVA